MIHFSPYELIPQAPIGARATTVGPRSGALLRLEFADGVGYADCHPQIEFGDAPLQTQLMILRDGGRTPLLARSFALAQVDAAARARAENIFSRLQVPASHLLASFGALDSIALDRARGEGFTAIKVKLGRDLQMELEQFKRVFANSSARSFEWRLDFNAMPSAQQVSDFLQECPKALKEKIEFIEDPFKFNSNTWQNFSDKYGVRLASDFEGEVPSGVFDSPPLSNRQKNYSYVILKPAVQDAEVVLAAQRDDIRGVVTSYLDHPLGQAGAAYVAGMLQNAWPHRMAKAGLLSHWIYKPNAFSEMLTQNGPAWRAPSGAGFGFDDLLSRVDWKPLQ